MMTKETTMQETTSKRRTLMLIAAAALGAAVLLAAMALGPSASAATTTTMKTCQDDRTECVGYVGTSWKKVRTAKASGGTYHVSSSKTKAATYVAAAGPKINLVTATGPRLGTAKVFVYSICERKVVKVVKFNLRTERSHYGIVKSIGHLPADGMYALIVVSADGKPVVVDAFKGFPVSGDHSDHHPPGTPAL